MSDGTPRRLDEVDRLGTANALLSTLHDVVRSMSTPLSAEELVPAIRPQLEATFAPHAIVLLAGDPDLGPLSVVHAEGVALGASVALADLPDPLDRGPRARPLLLQDLADGQGMAHDARAGAYLWLFARGRVTGLLAIEHEHPESFADGTVATLERLALPLSLALDNAVWFRRLKTLGADRERQRLGATLHDRFAQSLVAMAIGLDRAVRDHPEDEGLLELRSEVRATLGELRGTLRELRTTVDEDHPLPDVLRTHLAGVEQRHGVVARLEVAPDVPVPGPGIAQQLLRIGQDLTWLSVVERRATTVEVALSSVPGRLRLEVADDGDVGTPVELGEEARERLGSVVERVDAIGGRVVTDTDPDGTTVLVELRGRW